MIWRADMARHIAWTDGQIGDVEIIDDMPREVPWSPEQERRIAINKAFLKTIHMRDRQPVKIYGGPPEVTPKPVVVEKMSDEDKAALDFIRDGTVPALPEPEDALGIGHIGIPNGVHYALKARGIVDVNQLVEVGRTAIGTIPGIGKKKLDCIGEALEYLERGFDYRYLRRKWDRDQ